MEINVSDERQLVEVWLTNAEKTDNAIQEGLKELYTRYKKQKYMVAVFESGSRDLYSNALDLLAYNRRRCAELEVRREKKLKTAAAQR